MINQATYCSGCAAGCPIPNVPYPPEQYKTDNLITVFAPLAQQIPRQDCVQQATSLAVCAFDGSLGIKSGCCSTECATQMAQVSNGPALKQQNTPTAVLANSKIRTSVRMSVPGHHRVSMHPRHDSRACIAGRKACVHAIHQHA